MDGDLRRSIIDAAIRIVEDHGAGALTARKVTAAANTSTIAVYRLFGGMSGLLDAVADETFLRFGRYLAEVPTTDDPVADMFALGSAYRQYALANEQRYQLMFGAGAREGAVGRTDVTVTGHMTDRPQRAGAFNELLRAVGRMIDQGRVAHADASHVAARLWSALHGAVTLEIAGFFGDADNGLTQVLAPMTIDLLVGMGADHARTTQSLAKAASTALA